MAIGADRYLTRLTLPAAALLALVALYFWATWSWSYSTGERAGWVQKLSRKGWVCKTWEGELTLVWLPGTTAEKFVSCRPHRPRFLRHRRPSSKTS